MNYQKLIIVGNITANAERKTSPKSDVSFTTFRVAVSDRKSRTIFFPVTLFGKLGKNLAEYLTKGRQVTVDGRMSISEKGYFSLVADQVALGVLPKKKDIPVVETEDQRGEKEI